METFLKAIWDLMSRFDAEVVELKQEATMAHVTANLKEIVVAVTSQVQSEMKLTFEDVPDHWQILT